MKMFSDYISIKKLFKAFLCASAFLLVVFANPAKASAADYYHDGTGVLDDGNSWWTAPDFTGSNGTLPSTGDVGHIQSGISVEVTTPITVNYDLEVESGGTLDIPAGSTSLVLSNGGTLTVANGGTFNVGSGSTFEASAGSTFTQNNTFWSIEGIVNLDISETIPSMTTWGVYSGGSLNVNLGTLTVDIGGGLTLSTGSTFTVGSAATFVQSNLSWDDIYGTVNIYNAQTIGNFFTWNLNSGAVLNVEDFGNLTVDSGGTLDVKSGAQLNMLSGASITVTSGGNLISDAGGTLTLDSGANFTQNNSWTIDGTVNINNTQGEVMAAGWSVNDGGLVKINNGGTFTIDTDAGFGVASGGTLTIDGGGTMVVGSLEINLGGNLNVNAGGTLTMNDGATFTQENDSWTIDGTVNINNSQTIGDSFTWNLNSGAVLNVNSSGTLTVDSGGTLGVASGSSLIIDSGSVLTVDSGGTLDVQSNGTLTIDTGAGFIQNNHSWSIDGNVNIGSSQTLYGTDRAIWTLNDGSNLALTSGAYFTVEYNATLNVGSGSNFTIRDGATFAQGNDSWTIDGTVNILNDQSLSGKTWNFSSSGTLEVISDGVLTLDSGSVLEVNSSGNMIIDSDAITFVDGGTLTIDSGSNFDIQYGGLLTLGSNASFTQDNSAWTINGRLDINNSLTIDNPWTLNGEIDIHNGGNLTIGVGGSLDITSNAGLNIDLGGTFANTGTLSVEGAITNNGTWTNTGSITASGASVNITNNDTNTYTFNSNQGSPVSYDISGQTFNDGTNYNTTLSQSASAWEIVGTLPEGLSIDGDTGIVSGTPTTAGDGTFGISSNNIAGGHAIQYVSYSIGAAVSTFYNCGAGGLENADAWYEDSDCTSTPHHAVPTAGQTGIIQSGVTVTESADVSIDYTLLIQSGGTLSLNTNTAILTVNSGGVLSVDSGGVITLGNSGTLNLDNGSTLTYPDSWDIEGRLNLDSSYEIVNGQTLNITSSGSVEIQADGTLTVDSNSNLSLVTGGSLTFDYGATFNQANNLDFSGSLFVNNSVTTVGNTWTVDSGGQLLISDTGSFTVDSAAVLNVSSGSTLTINGAFTNNGNWTNNGTISISGASANVVNNNTNTLELTGTSGVAVTPYATNYDYGSGTNYNTLLAHSQGDFPPSGLPDGLSEDANTGEITGTPTAPGTGNFTVSTYVTGGGTVTQNFSYNFVAATVPTLSTADVDGTTLTLTYSEALDETSVPSTGDFTLHGTSATISGVSVTGSTVVLTLSNLVSGSDTVTIDYTTPLSGMIRDLATNNAVNLSGQSVTNARLSRTTITVETRPESFSLVGTKLYVNNNGSNSVSVIDSTTDSVIATIPVGSVPNFSSVVGTKLYVGNSGSHSVSVINTTTDAVTATIQVGSGPGLPAVVGTKVYVPNNGSSSVSVINTATDSVIATIPVGSVPSYSSLVGTKLYVPNVISGSVSVINTNTDAVITTIPVGSRPTFSSVVGTKLYVGNNDGGSVSVINTITDTLYDTYTPHLLSLTSTAPNGTYTSGSINITANFNIALGGSSKMRITLNTGDNVDLDQVSGSTLSGNYNIGGGNIPDLTVSSISSNPAFTSVTDTDGYTSPSFSVPASPELTGDTSRNLGDLKNIVVGTIPLTIPVGTNPYQMVTVGSLVYQVNQGSENVKVINTADNTVADTISVGSQPYGAAYNSTSKEVYVANLKDNTVSVIDADPLSGTYNQVTNTINVGVEPYYVASLGTKIYVTNNLSWTVSAINTANHTVTNTINVGANPRGIKAHGTDLYVANFGSNYNGQSQGTVSVINSLNNTVTATINVGSGPRGVAVNGNEVYVANWNDNTVSVIRTSDNTVTNTISVGHHPRGVLSLGTNIYVENFDDGTLSVIATGSHTVIGTYKVGTAPAGMTAVGTDIYISRFTDDMVDIFDTDNLILKLAVILDTTPPVRSLASPSGSLTAGTTTVSLSVTTDENSTCKYDTTANTAYASMAYTFTSTGGILHTTPVSTTDGTSYTYYVRCTDGSSNPNTNDQIISFSVASPSSTPATPDTGGQQTGGGGGGVGNEVVIFHNNQTPVNNPQACPFGVLFNSVTGAPCVTFNQNIPTLNTPQANTMISAGIPSGFRFTTNYAVNSINRDILNLQIFLNLSGYTVTKSGFGSRGLENKRFGLATLAALAKFQKANGIKPAVGYFGPVTRNFINAILKKLGL